MYLFEIVLHCGKIRRNAGAGVTVQLLMRNPFISVCFATGGAAALMTLAGCVTPAEPSGNAGGLVDAAQAAGLGATSADGEPTVRRGVGSAAGAAGNVSARALVRAREIYFLNPGVAAGEGTGVAREKLWPVAPDGKYLATFYTPFGGPFYVNMEAEPLENGSAFKANTRPGVAWKKLSGGDAAIGVLLAPFVFPNGMILHMRGTVPAPRADAGVFGGRVAKSGPGGANGSGADGSGADSSGAPSVSQFVDGEGFIGVATLASLRVKVQMPASGPGRILVQEAKPIAAFTLTPRDVGAEAQKDWLNPGPAYAALVEQIGAFSQRSWFDASTSSGGVKSLAFGQFLTDAKELVGDAQDDLEFLFSVAAAWRRQKDLPFPLIYRPLKANAAEVLAAMDKPFRPLEVKIEDGTAVITAAALLNAESVDVVFDQVLKATGAGASVGVAGGTGVAKPVRGIVLDLQNCPGIELAGLQVARWLIDRPVDAGVWFGRGERDAAISGRLAPKRIVVRTNADFAAADEELRNAGSVAITLEPMEESRRALAGMPLAVLHSRRTVTSAESLAEVLHLWRKEMGASGEGKVKAERVRFIGEVTGKRPQLTRELPLEAGEKPTKFDSGWAVRMPVFDWRPTAALAGAENGMADGGGEANAGAAGKPRLVAWKGCVPDETGNREAAISAGKAFVRRRGEK